MKSKLKIIQDLLREEKTTVFSDQLKRVTTEEKLAFRESLKQFNAMGESVYSSGKLKEVIENLSRIVETASRLVTEAEDGDGVDRITSGRQIKHVQGALKVFNNAANEVMINNRRMEAAFEDIAEGIQKYYDVH